MIGCCWVPQQWFWCKIKLNPVWVSSSFLWVDACWFFCHQFFRLRSGEITLSTKQYLVSVPRICPYNTWVIILLHCKAPFYQFCNIWLNMRIRIWIYSPIPILETAVTPSEKHLWPSSCIYIHEGFSQLWTKICPEAVSHFKTSLNHQNTKVFLSLW